MNRGPMPDPISDGALQDPILPEVLEDVERVLKAAGVEVEQLPKGFVNGMCAIALAVGRGKVAAEIAAGIDAFAAQAPQGACEGFTHTTGMVSGLQGAATIARRHGVWPTADMVSESSLIASYTQGERHERERIAFMVEELLPDTPDRDLALLAVREHRQAWDLVVERRRSKQTPS